jgi:hypothetical protein
MLQTPRLLLALVLTCAALAQSRVENIVLITADGLRWQELFNGIDPLLMNEKSAGMADAAQLRERLWADSPEERRTKLMPFFWRELAPQGIVLGNPSRNSSVQVANAFRVSYPGYSEILTGRTQDDALKGNAKIQNPSTTVLEFLRTKLALPQEKVALFASWDVFTYIGESKAGTVFINAGYQEASGSARMEELSKLQFRAPTPWDSVRHDYVTLEMALDYMRRKRPRIIQIALGEMDDWAHNRRYDRTLTSIEYFDQALRQVWEFVQGTTGYRDRTALLLTADHGRGSKLEDWHGHGSKVQGAEQIWAAIISPITPALSEVRDSPPAFQRDIAPTLLDLLSIDYREYTGTQGKPIGLARSKARPPSQ